MKKDIQKIPEEMRTTLTRGLLPLAEEFVLIATGQKEHFDSNSNFAIQEGWEFIKKLVEETKEIAQVSGISDGPIADRVDSVLEAVANGQLTIAQGKRLIEMLQAGFEITELSDLIGRLEDAGIEL